MKLPKDPDTGKRYELTEESFEPRTPKEKRTVKLLVMMAYELEKGNRTEAQKISNELYRMWGDGSFV